MSVHLHLGWITVGALADGFTPDNHVLPACGDLAGLERVLYFANGWVAEYVSNSQRLRWRLADGSASDESDYHASSLRENLHLVDFLKQENGRPVLVNPVLDFDNQAFIAVFDHLPDRTVCEQGLFFRALAGRELTGVEAEFLHDSLNHPWQPGACLHVPSDELAGLRSRYVYGVSEAYEHVYLNPDFYTWRCLCGIE